MQVHKIINNFTGTKKALEEKNKSESVRIFFSDISDTLEDQRDRLITEAQRVGAEVMEQIPPPKFYEEHAIQVKKSLSQASLAIHLFNEWAGRKIKDKPETTYPHEQLQLALSSSIPQLIWAPKNLVIKEKKHRALIENLKNGERNQNNYEFITAPISELENIVEQKIIELQQRSSITQSESNSFLISYHKSDQTYATNLIDYMARLGPNEGVDPEFDLHKESNTPTTYLEEFDKKIRQTQNLVFIFGRGPFKWLRGRMIEAGKICLDQLDRENEKTNIWLFQFPGSKEKIGPSTVSPLKYEYFDNSTKEEVDRTFVSLLLKSAASRETK